MSMMRTPDGVRTRGMIARKEEDELRKATNRSTKDFIDLGNASARKAAHQSISDAFPLDSHDSDQGDQGTSHVDSTSLSQSAETTAQFQSTPIG